MFAITLNVYTHENDEAVRKACNVLNDVLSIVHFIVYLLEYTEAVKEEWIMWIIIGIVLFVFFVLANLAKRSK